MAVLPHGVRWIRGALRLARSLGRPRHRLHAEDQGREPEPLDDAVEAERQLPQELGDRRNALNGPPSRDRVEHEVREDGSGRPAGLAAREGHVRHTVQDLLLYDSAVIATPSDLWQAQRWLLVQPYRYYFPLKLWN